MLQLLAIDTSTEVCSVAINGAGGIVSRQCNTPKSHAKVLLPLIDEVLKESGNILSDMDAIAVTRGPGSFTGIRIGLGVAQGLSYGAGLPIIGLSSLHVLAAHYYSHLCSVGEVGGAPITIVPALDARMSEVYWAAYTFSPSAISSAVVAQVCSPSDMLSQLEEYRNTTIFAPGHGWSVEGLTCPPVWVRAPEFKPSADALMLLAQQIELPDTPAAEINGSDDSPVVFQAGVVEPLYLRNEVSWKKRQRIRQ